MLRQFLTVLALISGLGAWAEPAQAARIASDITAASETEQEDSYAVSNARLDAQYIGSAVQRRNVTGFCPRAVMTVAAPTIQLKADRARE